MNKPAAISASLVDVRNVSAHKCVRLEIHVPAEQAGLVLAAFGWPTAVDPVPVAIARLDLSKSASEPRNAPAEASETKEQRKLADMSLGQRAGMFCADPEFRRFLAQRGHYADIAVLDLHMAAQEVREICGVGSRSLISDTNGSGKTWRRLESEYQDWKHTASLEQVGFR